MNFKQWLEAAQSVINTVPEALQTLGLSSGASKEEILKAYRELSRKHHPDMEQDPEKKMAASIKMKRLNAALDIFQRNGFSTNGSRSDDEYDSTYAPYNRASGFRAHAAYERGHSVPAWETDERSGYHTVGNDFRNLNYCKKAIYEKSMEARYGTDWESRPDRSGRGNLAEYTIQAWDGSYFRGVFSVFCDPSVLGFAGKAMEEWNSKGANSYNTEAVFANPRDERDLILIRLKGHDVADKMKKFEHESHNMNPSNDNFFCRNLQGRLDELAFEWGFGEKPQKKENKGWHNPEPDVDGPTDWHAFGTESRKSYVAASKWGEYHIDPIRPRGYVVKFANAGKNPKVRGAGLWQEVGKATTPAEAKRMARKHHKEISE